MTTFDRAFEYLIVNEGAEYTDDPHDSGGPTKYGVTLVSYQNFVKRSVPVSEIEELTLEKAKWFYHQNYWSVIKGNEIKSPENAICLFDSSVLYGPGSAFIIAQKVIRDVCHVRLKLDGIAGDMSLGLLNSITAQNFITRYRNFLMMRIDNVIANNPSNEVFRVGWENRVNRLSTLLEGIL